MLTERIEEEIVGSAILIVDDNQANVELLTDVLTAHGFRNVHGETDPRQALARSDVEAFDLFLVDIRMPHLDGFGLMTELLTRRHGDYAPILVLTAQTDQQTRRRALASGATDFLTKPFISWELLQRVRNMLHIRVLYRQLRDHNLDLERTVAARTRALADALAASRAADRAKLDFLAVMSHELRTPLNAIIGFAEILSRQDQGPLGHPDYGDYARVIEESGRGLLGMVNRILDLTRDATGTIALDEDRVALRATVAECVAAVRARAERRGLSITLAAGPEITLRADRRRLGDLLICALENAIKFNRDGGRIDAAITAGSEGPVVVIDDEGPGIDPDLVGRMFDPFTQGEGSLDRRHDGMGLGLPIIKRYAELHGGRVDLTPRPERGTRFRLTLPANRMLDHSPAPAHTKSG